MENAGGVGGGGRRRQRRMGPAPFASFEDLSDETESSPSDGPPTVQRLPGITEDVTTPVISSNLAPTAPRIDISRASSSSQHEDSRDSTPERELFQAAPGQNCARLGLAFKEEGALDLRSSTEELDFQDPTEQRRSPTTSITVVATSSLVEVPSIFHQRKDSQGSEFGGLLSISGRTSRLSSIGSQGSRVSGTSRLSVTSGISRSPSPHKMLLETSFCGSKTGSVEGLQASGASKLIESELERVLLSRKHDPTEAILAEGISIECRRKIQPADSLVQLSPVLQHAVQQAAVAAAAESPLSQSSPARSLTCGNTTRVTPTLVPVPNSIPIPPEKPARKSLSSKQSTDIIITVNKPSEDTETICNDTSQKSSILPGKIVSDSGVEYTYIPLKGPLPKDVDFKSNKQLPKSTISTTAKGRSAHSASAKTNTNITPIKNVPVISNTSSASEPQYIRIKLKPDHMYPDEPPENHSKPVTLDLSNGDAASAISRSPLKNFNNTPSPSVSRKSSFTSLFRGKDYGTSPESPTVSLSVVRKKPTRSRSKSSDRDRTSESTGDKSSKHRSVFTLFKSKKSCSKSKQSLNIDTSPCRQTASSLHSLEFTFDQRTLPAPIKKYYETPLEGDTIIIPLHSPGSEPPPPLPKYADETPESGKENEIPAVVNVNNSTPSGIISHRQSSTSSENVVFSTNLGSDNEIFTTKLPKCNNEREYTADHLDNTVITVEEILQPEIPPKKEISPTIEVKTSVTSITNQIISENKSMISIEESGTSERATDISVDENSSESERENVIKAKRNKAVREDETGNDHERKGLVLQDSFEDELPYIPTTLPQERSVAVPIVPVKQRASYEIRTCPIERPRSTTPINPSCLEDYCEDSAAAAAVKEKLRISLPREDSIPTSSFTSAQGRGKLPRRWTEFVQQQEPAPPLPPRGAPRDWINFEEIPERRKPPKRIQMIPSRGNVQTSVHTDDEPNVVYSYVNPEDCKCECHESGARQNPTDLPADANEEDELPLLGSGDRKSDSSPESQTDAALPPKRSAAWSEKSTNAFPHPSTTSS